MKKNTSSLLYTGTSGLVLPVPNKKSFPAAFQDKSRLTYYSSLFNTIEINSSFKKVPLFKTVERWATEVPGDFRFTIKLSKAITHNKGLIFDPADVKHFIASASGAGNKAGCLLLQFPGKLSADHSESLKELLASIRKYDPHKKWKIAVELRHPTWYQDATYQLLASYKACLVTHDMPPATLPLIDTGADFVYLRFHGPEKNYRGNYTDAFLKKYAEEILQWAKSGKTVYVYFNNTLGNAMQNLLTLNGFLQTL